MNIVEDEYC